MTPGNALKQRAFRVLAAVATVLLVFACVQGVLLAQHRAQQSEATRAWAVSKNAELAADMTKKLASAAQAAEALAAELSRAPCSPCEIEPTLHAFYMRHTEFTTLGVAYEAARSGTPFQLYAPFMRRNSPGARIERLDSHYDYLKPPDASEKAALRDGEHWYRAALAQKSRWLPPFYEPALPGFVIRYTAVVRDAARQEIGLVFVDLSLDDLADEMRRHDLLDNNYASLRSATGAELFHSLKSTAQIVRGLAHNNTDSEPAGIDALTGNPAWQPTNQVAPLGWVVTTTIDKSTRVPADRRATGEPTTHRWLLLTEEHSVPWVLLLVLCAISAYGCYVLHRRRTSLRAVWIDASACATLISLGVVGIWVLQTGKLDDAPQAARLLSNRAAVEQYQRDEALEALAGRLTAPRFVPVGLFVQSIEFLNSHNVEITGYIWHRYAEGEPSDYKVGTVFPEAISTEMEEVNTETSAGETLKSWYFKAVVRQNFSPIHYPFDRQSVWIRLWHEKLGESIKLVPDFKAYNSLNTRSLPGVEKDFVLSGWSLFQSFFSVQEKHYNTRLGSVSAADNSTVSELYFHIELSRNLLNPFLAHLFPLAVVMLMLYAIVLTMSIKSEGTDLLGFNAAAVVASCSALFFVALISHIQMRNELASNSVVYLEFFYLTTYVTILMSTANAVLLSLNVNLQLIRFHDNLLPKLLYWPFVTGVLLVCTGWIFW